MGAFGPSDFLVDLDREGPVVVEEAPLAYGLRDS